MVEKTRIEIFLPNTISSDSILDEYIIVGNRRFEFFGALDRPKGTFMLREVYLHLIPTSKTTPTPKTSYTLFNITNEERQILNIFIEEMYLKYG